MNSIIKVKNAIVLQLDNHNIFCKDEEIANDILDNYRYSDLNMDEFINSLKSVFGCIYLNNKGLDGLK